MPLTNSNVILADARRRQYGIPSLLAGNLEMIVGQIRAAEAVAAPLILAFNQGATPAIPLEIGMAAAADAARKASVPVATILDHGADIEQIVIAIRNGTSSVMFDGSHLPYEENVRQTCEIVAIAHAVGVDVEAELGAVGGSSIYLGEQGPQASMTDPEQARDFVERTGIDVLAISFGNAHVVYKGTPQLDLDRVREIAARVSIPLAMHGASGLDSTEYARVIDAGISKICYYTAMGRQVSQAIHRFSSEADETTLIYHNIIATATDFFDEATRDLLHLLNSDGKAQNLHLNPMQSS
ncbi:MAG: class II fructose-bisphosphate aldolase [Chloroflexi bacterium]|nr:class II fructose-bisphosphate aldolase [Chloroflexota bacterium]